MSGRWLVVLLALDLSVFAFLGVWGTGYGQTNLIVSITATHGIDTGDVPVVAIWLVGMALCWRLWRKLD